MSEHSRHSKKQEKKVETSETSLVTATRRDLGLRLTSIACLVAFLLVLTIYLAGLNPMAGLLIDDAWYTLLGKALATGQGYTLINSPSAGILPFYPPAWPMVLSLGFRLFPEFPENVYLLKAFSVAFMMGTGILSYFYFTRFRDLPRYLSLTISVAVTMSSEIYSSAVSTLMSECMFTFVAILTVVITESAADKWKAKTASAWIYTIAAGAAGALAFLTRSIAIAIVAAIVVWLLREKLYQAALVFSITVILMVAPWLTYARLHRPTPQQQQEQNSYIVYDYAAQFWGRKAGIMSEGVITVTELPGRVMDNLVSMTTLEAGGVIAAPIFSALTGDKVSGFSAGRVFAFLLSLLIITGLIQSARKSFGLTELVILFSVGVISLWGWSPFRFLLPLLPFWIFYLLRGCRELYGVHEWLMDKRSPNAPWIFMTVVAGCLALVGIYANVSFIRNHVHGSLSQDSAWKKSRREITDIMQWMAEKLPSDAVIATPNPALVYLHTGRRTVNLNEPEKNWENWKRLNVRYLAFVQSQRRLPLPSASEKQFATLYRVDGDLNLRIVDLGPPEGRLSWEIPSGSVPKIIDLNSNQQNK